MKRSRFVLAAVLLALGISTAAPALAADDGGASTQTCVSYAGDGYKQVTCTDADGNTVSDTTYFANGCVTSVDATGAETTSCPEVEPWINPWPTVYPDDVACDVEALTDADGSAYKLVTCRDTDGNVVSQTRYTEDGCVSTIDSDGNESVYCESTEPAPCPEPAPGVSGDCPDESYDWLNLSSDVHVESVGEMVDDCRSITLSDGSTIKACTDPGAPQTRGPLVLDDRGCVVTDFGDGNINVDCPGACSFSSYPDMDGVVSVTAYCNNGNTPNEQTLAASALCDYEQLRADGKIVILAICDDGCVELNGNTNATCGLGQLFSQGIGPRTGMHVPGATLWSDRSCWQREGDAAWRSVECPRGLYDAVGWVTGKVYKSTSANSGSESGSELMVVSTGGAVAAGAVDSTMTDESSDALSSRSASSPLGAATATRVVSAVAAGESPANHGPISAATAALALGATGAAGAVSLAGRRLRLTRLPR